MGLPQAVIEIGLNPYIELGPLRLAWHVYGAILLGVAALALYLRRGRLSLRYLDAMGSRRILPLLAPIIAATLVPITWALPVASSQAPAARTVTVGDVFFSPTSLSVRRGTRVRWVWRGRLRHNVTVVRGPARFRSRTQRSGSYSRVLRQAGRYRLICTIHGARLQSMRIRVR
ncbi:MAG: cupredoxin domain-containing protein [Thermoleophilaceae bacterium]